MPIVEGLPARRAALKMLDAVLRRGSTLDAAARDFGSLPPKDHALAIAIAGEALRRLPDIDSWIDGATRNRLPDDSKARMVLRLALAQKVGLDTPDHALVATALPLVDGGPRRLVHGVLGTLLRKGLPECASVRLPDNVEQRWRQQWGDSIVEAARRQIASRPALDLTFAEDSSARAFAAENGGTSLAPNHVRLASSSVPDMAGFSEGGWWVQDLAASMPARLIGPGCWRVLDLCAAPGGKTMQLSAAGHRVTALDQSQSRLARLRENLQRTKHEANLVVADALLWGADADYDAVLLDAPCSATGTFRRHPEVLYRARPQIIRDNAALQARLIRRAAGLLGAGGRLIYSVCSLEAEEGERIIDDFLRERTDFSLSPAKSFLPDFIPVAPEGWVRILPGTLEAEGGLDGFFMARLVRNSA